MAPPPKDPKPHALDSLFDEEPFVPAGKSIGADGNVEVSGGFTPVPTPIAHTSAPFPQVETFELAGPRPVAVADPLPPPAAVPSRTRVAGGEPERRGSPLFGVITLVLALAGGAVVWLTLNHRLPGQSEAVQTLKTVAGPVSISSEPDGATLRIDGTNVGRTPYAADNLYPSGQDIPFTLTLPGYQTYRGTFRGGVAAHVSVPLTRQ